MGFRGEAIASIASVARLSIASRTKNDAHAWTIGSEGGQRRLGEARCARAGHDRPGRGPLLQHPGAPEIPAHRADRVRPLRGDLPAHRAGAPDVAFTLKHNDRVSAHLRAQSIGERAAALLGREFLDASFTIDAQAGPLRLYGVAGTPQAARARADAQYLFVNGRYVRDRMLSHAVREAYRDQLHGERQPRLPAVPRARSARRGRQRAPGQDRSALPRLGQHPPVRIPCAQAGRFRRPPRRRRSPTRVRRIPEPDCNKASSSPSRRRRIRRSWRPRRMPCRCRPRRNPLPSASPWRNCTASTSSRRTRPGWCWWTCTPRTSASSWRS